MSPGRLFGKAPSTPEERQLALRIAIIFAIPMAFIMLIPLVIGGAIYRHNTQAWHREDRALIQRVNSERLERARAINEFVYEQCIQAEIRDVVLTQQLQAAIKRTRASLPDGALRRQQIQVLQDGINVLEPAGEPDCTPPPAVRKGPP